MGKKRFTPFNESLTDVTATTEKKERGKRKTPEKKHVKGSDGLKQTRRGVCIYSGVAKTEEAQRTGLKVPPHDPKNPQGKATMEGKKNGWTGMERSPTDPRNPLKGEEEGNQRREKPCGVELKLKRAVPSLSADSLGRAEARK